MKRREEREVKKADWLRPAVKQFWSRVTTDVSSAVRTSTFI